MEESVQEFLGKVSLSVSNLKNAIDLYIEGDCRGFEKAVASVSSAEQEADDIRRQLEASIFKFKLLPYTRTDYVNLLEMTDDIADKAEICAKLLGVYKPKISKKIALSVSKLMHETQQTVETLKEAILALNSDLEIARQKADETELKRELARNIEFDTLKLVFSGNDKDLVKFSLNEIVSIIGGIADKAEEVSDVVSALSVKYRN